MAIVTSFGALWASRGAPVADADLVAVAPFDVQDPSLALWKEGLVDVLSRGLDGAGALRTVPASIVIRRWSGRADAQSAKALGIATGARLVLFGGLLAAGDSVRASLTMLDTKTGRAIAEIEQRDLGGRIDRLSDSLTVAVLRALGESRRIDMAHATSWPTTSLAALKAYLQGEQFYRAALWDSAQTHFERALTFDTTFALAYHRLAAVRRWRDEGDIPDSVAYSLMRRPSRFLRGLGPREQLLATVDSLTAEAYFAWRAAIQSGQFAPEVALVLRLYATLEEGLRRYPNDGDLSFLLAEAHWRFDSDVVAGEVDDRATLARFDRAIALDSTFAPAYVMPISLAAYLDGAVSARRSRHRDPARASCALPRCCSIRRARHRSMFPDSSIRSHPKCCVRRPGFSATSPTRQRSRSESDGRSRVARPTRSPARRKRRVSPRRSSTRSSFVDIYAMHFASCHRCRCIRSGRR